MNTTEKRTALVTGASRGLGLALARELAQRGWTLILDARGAEALEAARAELAEHTEVVAIPGDVADEGHRRALAEAAREHGGLDALVNNASILGPSPQPELLDYPLNVLGQVYSVNVVAPLALTQAACDVLKPGARVINVSSDAGVEAYAGWGGYGSSKAALEQLSAILAAENPQWRVYWVDPGDMQTQMNQDAFPGEDISDRPLPEASVPGFVTLLEGDLPSGRYQARTINGAEVSNNRVQELRVALTVDNFDEAVTFYRDGLGLAPIGGWDRPDGRGLLLDAGRGVLELFDLNQAESVDQIEVGRRVSDRVRFALEVGNVDEVGSTLLAHGAAAVGEAAVITPWGHRNHRLQAPDGMQLTLFQVVDEEMERHSHEHADETA